MISCCVVNVNDTPYYSIKKIPTLLDFSSLHGTVCYTMSATWECIKHSACVTESLVVLPCLKLSLIWHTKVKAKSDWSVKTYIKADHNTITQFSVKVMSKYKVLSKREHGLIKNYKIKQNQQDEFSNVLLAIDKAHTIPHNIKTLCNR